MKRMVYVLSMGIAWVGASLLSAQERDDFVSNASHVVGTFKPADVDRGPESQVKAAKALILSLDAEQRMRLLHAIDSPERREWTNLPAPRNAGGIRLGDLNADQVRAACTLMATLLSEAGYNKMVGIMLADDQLLSGGRPRSGFGTENFSLVLFGTPDTTKPWAFQLDGHHVGVNVSIEGDALTMSPSFIGTQPQSFKLGDTTIRPLTGEIDDAYRLVNSLNDEHRKQAVIRDQRGQIATGPGNDNVIPDPVGMDCSQLDKDQQAILFRLISQWVGDLPEKHSEARMAKIRGELAQMKFSWNGETEVGSDISYRIQSPSLLIEYACQSLGGDPQQHLHTMYRDPSNEYGKQIKTLKR